MMNPIRTNAPRGIDWTFAGMGGVLLLINVPFLLGAVHPLHDTNYAFNAFYFFYNDLFFHGDLPLWEPFGRYGVQTYYPMITALSPASIFTGLVGWCLRIRDVLFLFNLSLFLEQLVFLYGTYLLSRELFRHKTTVVFVCLSAALSSMLVLQVWWNFRIYSMLPLVLYFGLRFFSGYRLRDLGLAVALFCISLVGVMPYVVSLMTLEVVVIGAFMLAANFRNLGGVLRQPKSDTVQDAALILLSAVALLAFYHIWTASVETVEGLGAARDPITHEVDLRTFFTYGFLEYTGFTGLVMPFGKFIGGSITIYAGLIPLLFIIYGLSRPNFLAASLLTVVIVAGTALLWYTLDEKVTEPATGSPVALALKWILPALALTFLVLIFIRAKDKRITAFAAVVALLALLSLGERTFVAKALYDYFPLMKYFRHIGYVVAGFKLFLPVLAGFGLESFLSRAEPESGAPKSYARASLGVAASVILGSGIYILTAHHLMPDRLPTIAALYLVLTALFVAAMFVARRHMPSGKHFRVFLVAGVCFQMLGFQGLVDYDFYLKAKDENLRYEKTSVLTARYDFQQRRTVAPPSARAALTWAPLRYPYTKLREDPRGWIINYAFSYNFIQWDPCFPKLKLDYINSYVAEAFRLKGGTTGKGKLTLPDDFAFARAAGCSAPKLRLMRNVRYAASDEESKRFIMEAGAEDMLVLAGVPESQRQQWARPPAAMNVGTMHVTRFSANELEAVVELPEGEGAWLYYADAWHPGWKAFVNGRPAHVARANHAFKAVMLDDGKNTVRFYFDGGLSRYFVYFFSALGFVFMAAVSACMARTFFRR